jgi:hypothetical protein
MEPASPAEAQCVELAAKAHACNGLRTFQLYPPELLGPGKGRQMLAHLMQYIKRRQPKGERLRPGAYLDIAMTADQQTILDPTMEDLMLREIL